MMNDNGNLCFTDDQQPGITRRKRGRNFHFFTPEGKRIVDREELMRLQRIGMPPAYVQCWFCCDANGHLQATGFDARGRKQYRYHPDFRTWRDESKFALCAEFGAALPKARARVEAALEKRSVTRERTLAAVIRLLDIGMVRVGNAQYEAMNGSYGATTLTQRHVRIEGQRVRLRYRGKSGKVHDLTVGDRGLVRFVRRIQDLPGQRLFQYLDAEGEVHEIGSSDVNAWIHETMGDAFTAKHFRTWGGSVVAFSALAHATEQLSIKELTQTVADALGNTPAISRKSYIHPRLIDLCAGDQASWRQELRLPRATRWLSREERGLIELLGV